MGYAIRLNAREDVTMAGHAPEEADDFASAWCGAMGHLSDALGVTVEIVTNPSGRTTSTPCADGEPLETVLWQAAHDLVSREEDGSWEWTKPSGERLSVLRRAVARAARA